MKARSLLLTIALLGCGEPSSPLLAMDSDRLWVLLQAAKVNPRCRELYAGSTDPRITGLAEKCAAAERRVVAWFLANGVDKPQAEELRTVNFWKWYSAKVAAIRQCRSGFNPGSDSYWNDFHGCDPYDRIIRVEKKTVADAGYREPKE